jgi:glycerol kinase
VYFVPAFSGVLAPYSWADARGVMVGLSRHVNKGHLARAALEAIAYQVRDVLDSMKKEYGLDLEVLKVDGPLAGNNLLMSLQADVLGVPVVRPKVIETASAGAAYAAGLAVGFWESLKELKKTWQEGRTWPPRLDAETRGRMYAGWLKNVEGMPAIGHPSLGG